MFFKKRNLLPLVAILLLIIGLSACTTNAPAVVENTVVEPTDVPVASAADGATIYNGLCIACHGADAKGVEGLGKDLNEGEFFNSATDEELVAFITIGREVGDVANSTGVAMPAKGGNPNLTEADLYAVVAYIRDLTNK